MKKDGILERYLDILQDGEAKSSRELRDFLTVIAAKDRITLKLAKMDGIELPPRSLCYGFEWLSDLENKDNRIEVILPQSMTENELLINLHAACVFAANYNSLGMTRAKFNSVISAVRFGLDRKLEGDDVLSRLLIVKEGLETEAAFGFACFFLAVHDLLPSWDEYTGPIRDMLPTYRAAKGYDGRGYCGKPNEPNVILKELGLIAYAVEESNWNPYDGSAAVLKITGNDIPPLSEAHFTEDAWGYY